MPAWISDSTRRSGTASGGHDRARSFRPLLQPTADLLVDERVVQQVEVVQSARPMEVVRRDRQAVVGAGVAAGALRRHEQVTEQIRGPALGVAAEGRED